MAITIDVRTLKDGIARGVLVDRLNLTGATLAAVTKGDLVIFDGTTGPVGMAGIAQDDYKDATTPIAFCIRQGVKLDVEGKNMADVDTAIVAGDALYWDPTNIAIHVGGGVGDLLLGRALEPVVSGATTEIIVDFGPGSAGVPSVPTARSYFVDDLSNIALNSYILNDWVPGFAGTIDSIRFVTGTTPASTAAKDIDLQPYIDDGTATAVTGGLLTLLTANVDTAGDVVEGTAVTALNTFSATDSIGIQCVEATAAFVEGGGTVELVVSRAQV